MSESESDASSNPADNWLRWYLQFVGAVTLLAFAAAVMPENWMVTIANLLGVDPFPDDPLTFYLARNLSVLYGFVGIALLILAANLKHYQELVGYLAIGTIAFGVCQIIVDAQAALPWWWTIGEGSGAVVGGAFIWWLYARSSYSD